MNNEIEQLRTDLNDARTGWEQAAATVREQDEEIASLKAQLAETQHEAAHLRHSFNERSEAYHERNAEIDRLQAQLAEARAEAAGLRNAIETHANERARNLPGLSMDDFDAALYDALSTPPSHYAKKWELMEKVVEAARESKRYLDAPQYLIAQLCDAFRALEAHEKGGEG